MFFPKCHGRIASLNGPAEDAVRALTSLVAGWRDDQWSEAMR